MTLKFSWRINIRHRENDITSIFFCLLTAVIPLFIYICVCVCVCVCLFWFITKYALSVVTATKWILVLRELPSQRAYRTTKGSTYQKKTTTKGSKPRIGNRTTFTALLFILSQSFVTPEIRNPLVAVKYSGTIISWNEVFPSHIKAFRNIFCFTREKSWLKMEQSPLLNKIPT